MDFAEEFRRRVHEKIPQGNMAEKFGEKMQEKNLKMEKNISEREDKTWER